jgi:hypothetical protein
MPHKGAKRRLDEAGIRQDVNVRRFDATMKQVETAWAQIPWRSFSARRRGKSRTSRWNATKRLRVVESLRDWSVLGCIRTYAPPTACPRRTSTAQEGGVEAIRPGQRARVPVNLDEADLIGPRCWIRFATSARSPGFPWVLIGE